jgi:hypothetical protein
MSFTSRKERDLNCFLIKPNVTSYKQAHQMVLNLNDRAMRNLGPGSYNTIIDFPELKKKTHSRKSPAFLSGNPPGKETVAIGSNYHNLTYNPGPGNYQSEGTNSPFYREIIKNQNESSTYFMQQNGGKLTKRTQWFSADKT